jgi:hypothetical protein
MGRLGRRAGREGDARDDGARDDAPELTLLQFMEEIDQERAEHANQWQSVAISGNQGACRACQQSARDGAQWVRPRAPPTAAVAAAAAAAAGSSSSRLCSPKALRHLCAYTFAIYVCTTRICPRCARAKAPGLPAPGSQLPFVIIESHVRCRTLSRSIDARLHAQTRPDFEVSTPVLCRVPAPGRCFLNRNQFSTER